MQGYVGATAALVMIKCEANGGKGLIRVLIRTAELAASRCALRHNCDVNPALIKEKQQVGECLNKGNSDS